MHCTHLHFWYTSVHMDSPICRVSFGTTCQGCNLCSISCPFPASSDFHGKGSMAHLPGAPGTRGGSRWRCLTEGSCSAGRRGAHSQCNDYLSGRCMVSFQQPSTNRWGWRWYFSSPLIRALWEQRHKWRCFPSSLMRREVRQRNQFAFVSPGHSSCCDMHSPSHFYHSPFSCLFLLLFLLPLPPSGPNRN